MKRLPVAVIVIVVAGLSAALVACGSDDENDDQKAADRKETRKDCPKGAAKDPSYSGEFEGPVSMDERKHVLKVTRDGRPVSGAQVCINTAMVGMRSMKYSAKGNELAPGRYRVGFKFEMEGTYRGNVVTRQGGEEVSIPVSVKVPSGDKKSDDMKGDMKDDEMDSDGKKSDDMKSHDEMESDEMKTDGK